MNPEALTLKFEGPLQVFEYGDKFVFSHPVARLPGIYFSAVYTDDNKWLMTYIGETSRPMGIRIKEHVIQLAGGNYRICDPVELRRGKEVVLWNGLWRKGTRDKLPEFIHRIHELSPAIKKLLEIEYWFCAPLDCEKRILRRIEGCLAERVRQAQSSGYSLLSSDIRYTRCIENKFSIRVETSIPIRVHGIPTQIDI
jgi:hypothetical protein